MWTVITTELFAEWFEQQEESVQEKVLAALVVLEQKGPSLGRPWLIPCMIPSLPI